MHFKVCSTPLLLLLTINAFTQPGTKDSIYSKSLGEERRLQIQLPAEYKSGSGQKYPVIYLLDGEWNAELFQQVQAWSRQWGFTPPIIMVGVVNSYPNNQNQRFRDLTPTPAGQDGAGGGPKLLSFLKDELIPYINKTYPSNGSNILWGHSLGGLFVLYTLFTEPRLFDSYIAADPSLWWDHGFLMRYAKEKMNSVTGIKSLFITGRTGSAYHDMRIDSLEMLLKDIAPPSLQWKAVAYPDETHISQQYKSAYDGLKYTLAPLLQDRIHIDPLGGIVAKGMPFTVSCNNLLADKYMRFSTNGSTPTLASEKMQSENVITPVSDVSLNIRTFIERDSADKVLAATYKMGAPLRAREKPNQAVKGAWSFACYKSAADSAVIRSGTTLENINLNQLDSNDFFCRIGGWLETEKKGYYIFEVAGEPGTKLFIGDRLLMEIPKGTDYNSFIVPMEKGYYAIRFEYAHHKEGKNFDFGYKLPDASDDGPILPSMMYHE
jgi:predicted alpha/beta superfamily hydrolase